MSAIIPNAGVGRFDHTVFGGQTALSRAVLGASQVDIPTVYQPAQLPIPGRQPFSLWVPPQLLTRNGGQGGARPSLSSSGSHLPGTRSLGHRNPLSLAASSSSRPKTFGPGAPRPEPPLPTPPLEFSLTAYHDGDSGQEKGSIYARSPALLFFSIRGRNGAHLGAEHYGYFLENFHEEWMHSIVVSRDLRHFAHVHPQLVNLNTERLPGRSLNEMGFVLYVNREGYYDPDGNNFAAERAFPFAGAYYLFNEIKPTRNPIRELRFPVDVQPLINDPVHEPTPLEPDPVRRDGSLQKDVGDYRFTMKPEFVTHHGRTMLHFGLHVEKKGPDGKYEAVDDLVNWLGMPGHAILIGEKGDIDNKVFRHLHAGHHGGHGLLDHGGEHAGPDLMFMLGEKDIPPDGRYKMWFQIKHGGEVRTVDFVLDLKKSVPHTILHDRRLDEKAIEALNEGLKAAFAKGDVDAIMDLHAVGAVLQPNDGSVVRGGQVREFWKEIVKAGIKGVDLHVDDYTFSQDGSLAGVAGIYKLAMQPGGDPIGSGRYTMTVVWEDSGPKVKLDTWTAQPSSEQ